MGNTFRPVDLGLQAWPQTKYEDFQTALRTALADVKNERLDWYLDLQKKYRWVTRLRHRMVLLGASAAVATAAATVLRVLQIELWGKGADVWLLILAVLLYAGMAALAFYERMEEGSGHYFRSVLTILQIRDLWTDYQFKDAALSLEPTPAGPDLPALKKRWLDQAQTFVVALDKQATSELNKWHTAFSTAIKDLTETASTGLKSAQEVLDKTVKEQLEQARKAADDAKKEAEAAKQAAKTGIANVKIEDGSTGEATVKLDGAIVRHGPEREFVIPNISQGRHVVRVEVAVSGATTPPKAAEIARDFTADVIPISLKPV